MSKTKFMEIIKPSFYWVILAGFGLWVLVAFLTPSARHSGLNLYEETRFPAMVQGTAYKPFVYRTILPGTVRILTIVTPQAWHRKADEFTGQNQWARKTFQRFEWDFQDTLQYYFAAFLMWLSYVGFAHVTVRLTCQQLQWKAAVGWQAAMGAVALLGLPAMFKYSSFPYDPSQLFLFSLALSLLASERIKSFGLVFLLCCLSKETAVLLIPVHGFFRWKNHPAKLVRQELIILILSFAIIKGGLIWMYRDNPGTFAKIHLFDHNLGWILGQWRWIEMSVALVLAYLVFFRWQDKPRFLRVAFLCIMPVLLGMALIIGFFDEWRIFYEVYAIIFAMGVATVRFLTSSAISTRAEFLRSR